MGISQSTNENVIQRTITNYQKKKNRIPRIHNAKYIVPALTTDHRGEDRGKEGNGKEEDVVSA